MTEMAKVYDPLGWVLPVVVRARIFLRKIWRKEYQWDVPFEKPLAEEWLQIRAELQRTNEVKIPRAYATNGLEEAERIEIHAFCDASAEAYGVVVYLLVQGKEEAWSGIVAAKSKLSPKTTLSIPRLELLAAVIATKYTLYLEKYLKLDKEIDKFLWGDSKCVISWMTQRKVLPAFIQKAAQELERAKFKQFNYAPSAQNPADVVSRGTDFKTLKEQNWWNGPKWLTNRDNWPKQDFSEKETQSEKETADAVEEEEKLLLIKTEVQLKSNVDLNSTDNSPFDLNPELFSTMGKLIRRTAYCLRAASKFLRGRGTIAQQTELDYEDARNRWHKWDQQRVYEPANKKKSNVSYLRNLQVREDENGIIRCLTRMKWARVSRDEAEPILLPKKTPLTKLLILSIHYNNRHAGTAHTLAILRRQHWLPQGRREVYMTLKNHCHVCRRFEAEPYKNPDIAPLPEFRINRTERPFTNVGLDTFGPFRVQTTFEGKTIIHKRWIVIFTCLVVRAIHLEVLQDMTADEFLVSLRKFVGRRGVPKLLVADNAPQFKVVERIFQCVWRRFAHADVTNRYYAEHNIKWKFIPPESPWMGGGAYERMIRTVKKAYERVYGEKVLTDQELQVAIVEVEAVVNNRPITYVDQENDTAIVSPNDFLCVRYPSIPVDWSKAPTRSQLADSWRAAERYLEEFWKVWSEHYLRSIRERKDMMGNSKTAYPAPPKPGELVLMVDPDGKRSSWKTAVIERVLPSQDGATRAAQIRIGKTTRMIRPINKLAPLRLIMDLPKKLPELTEDRSALVVDDQPGFIEA